MNSHRGYESRAAATRWRSTQLWVGYWRVEVKGWLLNWVLKDKQRFTRETRERGESHQGQEDTPKQIVMKRPWNEVFRELPYDWRPGECESMAVEVWNQKPDRYILFKGMHERTQHIHFTQCLLCGILLFLLKYNKNSLSYFIVCQLTPQCHWNTALDPRKFSEGDWECSFLCIY